MSTKKILFHISTVQCHVELRKTHVFSNWSTIVTQLLPFDTFLVLRQVPQTVKSSCLSASNIWAVTPWYISGRVNMLLFPFIFLVLIILILGLYRHFLLLVALLLLKGQSSNHLFILANFLLFYNLATDRVGGFWVGRLFWDANFVLGHHFLRAFVLAGGVVGVILG